MLSATFRVARGLSLVAAHLKSQAKRGAEYAQSRAATWTGPVLLVTVGAALLLAGAASASTTTPNSWTSNGPYTGTIRALAAQPGNPAVMLAAVELRGIYRTTDAGATWTLVLEGVDVSSFAFAASAPGTVYASLEWFQGFVIRSDDSGVTWQNAGGGHEGRWGTWVVADPTNAATAYAGVLAGGVYKTTNAGASWNAMNTGLADLSVNTLAIDPEDPSTVLAGTSGGSIFRSFDGGGSWALSDSVGSSVQEIVIDPTDSWVMYAATSEGFFKSVDGGATWDASNTGLFDTTVTNVTIDPADPSRLFVGTFFHGVYRSVNAGSSWTFQPFGGSIGNGSVMSLTALPGSLICAGVLAGVACSQNFGATWHLRNHLLDGALARVIAVDPTNPAVVYAGLGTNRAGKGNGIFKSTDGGVTWTDVSNGMPRFFPQAIIIDPVDSSIVYVGFQGGIYKTTTGGASWQQADGGLTFPDVWALAQDITDRETLWAGTLGDGVYKTTDGGVSWTPSSTGLDEGELGGMFVHNLVMADDAQHTLYLGAGGGVFKSIDGGAHWTEANGGRSDNLGVFALAVDPSNPTTLYSGVVLSGGVFRSTDSGESWTRIVNGLEPGSDGYFVVDALAVDPNNPGRVYVAYANGIAETRNGGGDWHPFGTGLDHAREHSALAMSALAPDFVLAGVRSGVYSTYACELGVDDLVLDDNATPGMVLYEACNSISAGTAFTVAAGDDVTFCAPRVILRDGFAVETGGNLTVNTTPP